MQTRCFQAMYLSKLTLLNFKNYEQVCVEPGPGVNCFVGSNGVGKTNVLDAVHYLSLCKSFFHTPDTQNIRHDAPFFVIEGEYKVADATEHLYCGVKRGSRKRFRRNKKDYERFSDHIGLFPLVMVSPFDSGLIWEGSEERRRMMDEVISQFDSDYLSQLVAYNRVLAQRNSLLKQWADSGVPAYGVLEALNEQLTLFGSKIFAVRTLFIKELLPVFHDFYSEISLQQEVPGLAYQSALSETPLSALLRASAAKDLALQYTSTGVHRDDLLFTLGGYPLKRTGSQGQQKSFLTALKLAVFEFIKAKRGVAPILLLDDIFDKFDQQRVERILQLVSGDRFGQIFITDTHPERMEQMLRSVSTAFRLFDVAKNQITLSHATQ